MIYEENNEGLQSVESYELNGSRTSRWSREEKPFILKRHSTVINNILIIINNNGHLN